MYRRQEFCIAAPPYEISATSCARFTSDNSFSRSPNARSVSSQRCFAGLWEGFKWPDGTVMRRFTVITTHANGTVGECMAKCR